jgi:hypothetical protein
MLTIKNQLQVTPCSVHKTLDVVLQWRLGEVDGDDTVVAACEKVG